MGGPGLLLGPLWAVLGALGASVGGPGAPLEPLEAVMGRPWGPCGRSWAALGTKVALSRAGMRSGQGTRAEKWPKPERERNLHG